MLLRDYISWTVATLGSIFMGVSLLYESYLLLGIGLLIFASLIFMFAKGPR